MRSLQVEKFAPVTLGPPGPLHLSDWGWEQIKKEFRQQRKLMPLGGGAGQFSSFAEQAVLNHLTGQDNAAWPSLNSQFLAACTVVPTSSSTGSTITEAGYTGYARLNISGLFGAGGANQNDGAFNTAPGIITSGIANAGVSGSGFRGPGAAADVTAGGTLAWSSTANILGWQGTGSFAVSASGAGTTHQLQASSYGFEIPSTATILGITVQLNRKASVASAVTDATVQLMKAGATVGSNKAAGGFWSNVGDFPSYGTGVTDLWGTTWTPSDVNNSGFGVAVAATNTSGTAQLGFATITVAYTLGFAACTGGSSTVIAVARCTALTVGNVLGWSDVPSTVVSTTQTPLLLSPSGSNAAYFLNLT